MEMSTRWRKELTWRCFLVSAVTIVAVRCLVASCVAKGHCSHLAWASLAWFQQAYPSPYGQTWAFVLLAVLGGWLGSVFTSFNTWVCLVRRRWSRWFSFRILEVCALSALTSAAFFALPLAGRCRPCRTGDGAACVAGEGGFRTFRGLRCAEGQYNDLAVLAFNPQGYVIQVRVMR